MMILLVYLGLKITILLVLRYPVFPQYPALSCPALSFFLLSVTRIIQNRCKVTNFI